MTRWVLLATTACAGGLDRLAPDAATPEPIDGSTSDVTAASDADTDVDSDADTDTDTDTDTDPTTDSAPPPWTNGDPSSPPPVPGPPPDLATPCADAGMLPSPILDDPDNEVIVDGVTDTADVHHLSVSNAGWYHLYNDPPANDGALQWNESVAIRITNPTFPTGSTVLTNCDADWITVDGDNVAPVALAQYLGTFWFDAGDNAIEVAHFCPIVLAGGCGALENTNDPASTCAADGNRLRMVSNGLCIDEP